MSAAGIARKLLRRAWRRARGIPVVGTVIRFGDRVLWARVIRSSGLVDADYYAAQRGWNGASVRRATRDYVHRGFRDGLSLNVLMDEVMAGRDLPEPARVPSLYAYLVSDRATVHVHPWWDAPAYVADIEDQPGPVELAWSRGDREKLDLCVGEVSASMTLGALRAATIGAAREWAAGSWADRGFPGVESGTVVRFLQPGDLDYDRKVVVAAELAATTDVVVAGIGLDAAQWTSLALARMLHPRLRASLSAAGTTFAAAVDAAAEQSDAGLLAFIDPRARLGAREISRLLHRAGRGVAAMPVPLRIDGTIEGVGAARIGDRGLYRILEDHPAEDLAGFDGDAVDVPLLTGRTFSIDASDLRRVGGMPRSHGDGLDLERLSARLRSRRIVDELLALTDLPSPQYARETVFSASPRRRPRAVRATDATRPAVALLRRARFEVTGWASARGFARPRLRWVSPTPGMRRWAIKICAPAGPPGDVWGDRHFAHGLASALRRAGQFVVVDAFDARDRSTNGVDDVTVVVRGPYRIRPPRHGVRVEWIISHPDQITSGEIADFDLVFAASERWSAKASARWGMPVVPLLECTDVDQFHPRDVRRGDDIVFVGTARGIARPSVVAPLRAGIPVRVYGPDWRTYIPASAIAAVTIPNDRLPDRYASASIVLNDHWPAMRREGFMAMRPFDVVAAGGRVVSEDVDGLAEIFEGAVVTYADEAELVELLRRDPTEIFPDDDQLGEIAQRVRRDHSFDARAGEIIRAVEERSR